jgi:hypothetical protein
MTPKRGQPLKPPEKRRDVEKRLRYSPEEIAIVEEAYKISESKRPFLRWLANTTIDEARKIIESAKK